MHAPPDHNPVSFPVSAITPDSGGSTAPRGLDFVRAGLAAAALACLAALPAGAQVTITYYDENFDTNVYVTTAPADPTTLYIAAGTATQKGMLTGSGSIIKSGAGTLILSGNNTYSGETTLAGGTLRLASANAIGTSGLVLFEGGTLQFSAANNTDYSDRFSTATDQQYRFDTNGQSVTFASALASTRGSLTKLGAGTLALRAANTFTDGTTLVEGTLELGHLDALGPSGTISFDGGTLRFTRTNTADYSDRFSTAPGQQYRFDTNGQSVTFAADMTAAGSSLAKSGAGTLVLTGATSFSNGITVSAGTLQIGNGGATGSLAGTTSLASAIVFDHGSNYTLDQMIWGQVSASGDILGTVVKRGAGTLTVVASPNVQSMTIEEGAVHLASGSNLIAQRLTMSAGTTLDLNGNALHLDILLGSGQIQTGAGSITLTAVRASEAALVTPSEFAGAITGAGGLSIAGNRSLLLTGANTYTGTTVLLGTQLQVGAGGSTGSLTSDLALNDGTVTFDRSGSLTYAGAVSGTGELTKRGDGTLTLTGNNTFDGAVNLAAGTLNAGSANALGSSALLFFDGGTLQFSAANTVDYSGRFGDVPGAAFRIDTNGQDVVFGTGLTSMGGSLTKLGAGSLTLATANAYSGGTNVDGGTLRLGADGALADSGALTIAAGATLDLDGHALAAVLSGAGTVQLGSAQLTLPSGTSFGGEITGSGSVRKADPGATVLGGANTFTGGTTITAGVLQIGGGGTSGSIAGNIANDSILAFSRSDQYTHGGVISGTGDVQVLGSGTLVLSGDNTYTGSTLLLAGTLRPASPMAISTTDALVFNGGTLQFSAGNTADLSAWFSTAANQQYRIDTNGQDVILASALVSSGGTLAKLGSGTLTLTGANSFANGATIAGGTLRLGSAGALGSTGTIAFAGGTLQYSLDNTTDYSARFSTAAGQQFRIDTNGQDVGFVSTLAGAGSTLTKLGDGMLVLAGTSTYTGGTNLAGGTLAIIGAAALGSSGDLSFTGGTLRYWVENTTDYSPRFSTAANQQFRIDTYGNSVSFASDISSPGGSLTKLGPGRLSLAGSNSFTGGVTVAGGYLRLDSAGALGSSGAISLVGGVLEYTAGNTTDYSARLSAAAGQPYQIDTNGQDVTFATGLSSPAADLVKYGDGTLILSGTNTFTGTTSITRGTLQLGAGGANGSLGGPVSNSAHLAFNRGDDATFSQPVYGTGAVTNQGPGTLTLAGANTYTGGTTLAGGTLQLGSAGAVGASGTLTFAGGTLQFSAANTTDYSPRFSTAAGQQFRIDTNGQNVALAAALTSSGGTLTKLGAGTLSLGGDNTFTGGVTLAGGALSLGHPGALGSAGTIAFAGGTLRFTAGNSADYSPRFSPAAGQQYRIDTNGQSLEFASALASAGGSLTKSGTGTLTLTGANTFAGGTTIAGGTLQVGNGGAAGSLVGNVSNSGTLAFHRSDTIAYTGEVSGTGQLVKLGGGTLTLSGNHTYTGSTNITAGALALGADHVIPDSSPVLIGSGATLAVGGHAETLGALTGSGTISLAGGSLTLGHASSTFDGSFTGSGTITKAGAGTLTLTGSSSFNGQVALDAGTLFLNGTSALGTGALVLNGGRLETTGGNSTIGNAVTMNVATTFGGTHALTFSGAFTLTGFKPLAVTSPARTTITGTIGESTPSSLLKQGTGELELTGANTYTGGTFIQAGTVRINNASGSAFGTGAVTVASGATLTGAGSFTGVLQLNGILSPGNSPGITATGSQTWAGGASYLWEINSATGTPGTNWDRLDITGTLHIAANPSNRFTVLLVSLVSGDIPGDAANFDSASSYAYTIATASGGITGFAADAFTIDSSGFTNAFTGTWSLAQAGNNLNLVYTTAVPEPATAALLAGLAVLLAAGLRRRGRARRVIP